VSTALAPLTAEERTEEARLLVTLIDAKLATKKRVVFGVRSMEFLIDMRQRFRTLDRKDWVTGPQLETLRKMKDRLF